jgi:predicted ester cyclase
VTIERLIAEDDWVAELARFSGTHLAKPVTPHHGDLRGIEPTGKKIEVWQSHFWRLRDGLIVEHEPVRDDLGIFRQLGLIPTRA